VSALFSRWLRALPLWPPACWRDSSSASLTVSPSYDLFRQLFGGIGRHQRLRVTGR
jgi:hypothetical protein